MILPNFLICGAQKSGTTALHTYLDQHPDVYMSRPKETWFFDRHYQKGIDWFADHFEGHDGEKAIGEASASTMSDPRAPSRIAQHLPQAKLLFVLRNPVDRAYSQYHFYVYTGKIEPERSFHEVVRDEESEIRRDMIERGNYVRQLERFDEHFDRSRMKVLLHERLREDTMEVVEDVFRFLAVDPSFEPDVTSRHNVTSYPVSLGAYRWVRRTWHWVRGVVDAWFPGVADAVRDLGRGFLFTREQPTMREDVRAYLREMYADANARLEERIGRDLSHWR